MTNPNEREALVAEMRQLRASCRPNEAESDGDIATVLDRWIAALTREQREGDPRKAALDELAHENERLGLSYADAPQQEAQGAVALYAMFRALVDAGGAATVARHGAMPRPEALTKALQDGMIAIERMFHPERFDDFPAATPPAPVDVRLRNALIVAEAALADIGDADREPGDDLAWCEQRAARAARSADRAKG